MNKPRKKWAIRITLSLFGAFLAVVAVMWHYGIYNRADYRMYKKLQKDFHPAWLDAWKGRFKLGSPFVEVLAAYPISVSEIENFPPYMYITYYAEKENLRWRNDNHMISFYTFEGKLIHARAWIYQPEWEYIFLRTRPKFQILKMPIMNILN